MSVEAGFVGSSAKLETGKEWMSEARKELRLTSNGWMSEMIGESVEIRFINIVDITAASIYELMGSPTAAGNYIFENTATISADTQSGTALSTGTFPAGSTLTIVNKGYIRGGGGNGGTRSTGGNGGTAISLDFPIMIDNAAGYIYAGGGGGAGSNGGDTRGSGGGGAGTPAGLGRPRTGDIYGSQGGNATNGGNGGVQTGTNFGRGGGPGQNGGNGGGSNIRGGGGGGGLGGAGGSAVGMGAGGRAGYSVQLNGHSVTWLGGDTAPNVYGPVV